MEELENMQQEKMIEKIKKGILRKFPLLGATMANLIFEPSNDIQTAATDGKRVVYSPKFVEKLTYDEKVFLFSHEIMHDAFDHIMRSKDKDPELWNEATDAVINQMLKVAKLPLPTGGIDMPEADGKSAEEVYEMLQEKKRKQQQNGQGQSGESGDDQQHEGQQQQGQQGEHDMWKDAVSRAESMQQDQSGEDQDKPKPISDSMSSSDVEKIFTEANEELKQQIGKRIREQLKKQKEQMLQAGSHSGEYTSQFGDVGEASAVLSWKKILKRELEKEEDRWTYRRADEENDYQARIGTLEVLDYPETEVMLDTSGSVDEELLKNFLRQLKPLLKESKLRVGCFDTKFYGFEVISSSKDIDNFIIKGRGGTSFNSAVVNFSKKKNVNKIVFTDGYDAMTLTGKEHEKIIWLVWDKSSNFKPSCGKVIFINRNEIKYKTTKPKNNDFGPIM